MNSREAVREVSRQQQLATNRRAGSSLLVGRMLEAQRRERLQLTAELVKVKGLMRS